MPSKAYDERLDYFQNYYILNKEKMIQNAKEQAKLKRTCHYCNLTTARKNWNQHLNTKKHKENYTKYIAIHKKHHPSDNLLDRSNTYNKWN
jgi:hypothetical protein